MPSLVAILRDILLVRRGPQDLPYSPLLLAVAALASLAGSYWATVLLLPQQPDVLLHVSAALLLQLGSYYLLLNAFQRKARFVQTSLANLLVDVAFTLAILPLLPIFEPMTRRGATPDTVTAAAAFASLLFIAFGIWRVVVAAHILRQALDVRLLPALLIYVALVVTSQIMLGAVFGGAEGN
ncbi:MAG: hypothetical protein JNN30_02770 [Rhodanobacteraceae bacterium]|nr:hypothetical protein [Rhodanobacteraceae bacterium]